MSETNASMRRDDWIVLAAGILVAVLVTPFVDVGWLLGLLVFLGVALAASAVTAIVLRRLRR